MKLRVCSNNDSSNSLLVVSFSRYIYTYMYNTLPCVVAPPIPALIPIFRLSQYTYTYTVLALDLPPYYKQSHFLF